MYSGQNEIVGGCKWHGYFGREPFECRAHPSGSCVPHPNGVALVSFESRAGVPTIGAMWRPGGAFAGFNVCNDANAGGREWGAVAIESAVHLCVGRELGVDSGAA